MLTPSRFSAEPDHAKLIIGRLAAALNCSAEVFSGEAPHELSQTLELLSLWLAMDHGPDRAKVLGLARNLSADKQETSETRARMSGEVVTLTHAMQKPVRDL